MRLVGRRIHIMRLQEPSAVVVCIRASASCGLAAWESWPTIAALGPGSNVLARATEGWLVSNT